MKMDYNEYDEATKSDVDWFSPNVVFKLSVGVVITFCVLILVYAIVATIKLKRKCDVTYEEFTLGGRSIGLTVTSLSLAAPWLCGSSLAGTTATIFSYGLVWAHNVIGSSLSLLFGGLIFAKGMRKARHVTLLEPFTEKYGHVVTIPLLFILLFMDTFTSAALLHTIGLNMSWIIGIPILSGVLMTSLTAFLYSAFGGLLAVAYTGVIQLVMVLALWVGVGFAYNHPYMGTVNATSLSKQPLVGEFPRNPDLGIWIDNTLLVVFGTIPLQMYFQRVLSCKSAAYSQVGSVLASIACLIMAVPVVFLGYIARNTDWTLVAKTTMELSLDNLALPAVLHFLCPTAVGVMGLCAVTASVMSTVDSCFLSSATLITHHLYLPLRSCICKAAQVSDKEKVWVARIVLLLVAIIHNFFAISVANLFGFWFLAADLCYIILFPHLLCLFFIPITNIWGSLAGLFIGLLLRILAGEPLIHLPVIIKYPYYYEEDLTQNFPHKTLAMIVTLLTIILVSLAAKKIIERRAPPEVVAENKSSHWYGQEGTYRPRDSAKDSDISLSKQFSSEESDTKL